MNEEPKRNRYIEERVRKPAGITYRKYLRRTWIVRKALRFKWFLIDLSRARQNADAAHSARFILADLNHPEGVKALAEISGLPEGVIVSAMFTICCDESEENRSNQGDSRLSPAICCRNSIK